MQNINENIEVLGHYVGCGTKILCRCRLDGHEWQALPSNLLRGSGCPKCYGNIRKTHEEFVNELFNINKNIKVVGEYKNAHTKILCKCKICDNEWYAKPQMLTKKINPTGCPNCAISITKQKCSKTHSEFIKQVNRANKNIKVLSEYKNNNIKVSCKCMVCQYKWDVRPADLIKENPNGCPKCGNSLKKSHEDFVSEIHNMNKDITVLGKYVNSKTKILFKCKSCGYEWEDTPNNLLRHNRETGCPACNYNKSYGEEYIRKILIKNKIEYVPQKTFDDLRGINNGKLSYDFYIPAYNILIEYQGQQHYKPSTFGGMTNEVAIEKFEQQVEHDKLKREYAKLHNITLIEIPYWDFDNIDKILIQYLHNKSA